MKKILLIVIAAAGVFAACQNETRSERVAVSVVASVSGSEVESRAFGDGAEVNRCIVEVYTEEGALHQRAVAAVEGLSAEVMFELDPTQRYSFVAWSDRVEAEGATPSASELEADLYYTTRNGLKAIAIADIEAYQSEGDRRDAFFANAHEVEIPLEEGSLAMTLKRPFGQLNVLTDFYDGIVSFTPTEVRVRYSTELFTEFNASNGEVAEPQTVWWDEPQELTQPYTYYNDHVVMTTDYILAPYAGENDDKEIVVNFEIAFYNELGRQVYTNDRFDNIPVKRNYRTNVYGASLPGIDYADVSITVTIDPAFEAEEL